METGVVACRSRSLCTAACSPFLMLAARARGCYEVGWAGAVGEGPGSATAARGGGGEGNGWGWRERGIGKEYGWTNRTNANGLTRKKE